MMGLIKAGGQVQEGSTNNRTIQKPRSRRWCNEKQSTNSSSFVFSVSDCCHPASKPPGKGNKYSCLLFRKFAILLWRRHFLSASSKEPCLLRKGWNWLNKLKFLVTFLAEVFNEGLTFKRKSYLEQWERSREISRWLSSCVERRKEAREENGGRTIIKRKKCGTLSRRKRQMEECTFLITEERRHTHFLLPCLPGQVCWMLVFFACSATIAVVPHVVSFP